jgi:hypothetical protein
MVAVQQGDTVAGALRVPTPGREREQPVKKSIEKGSLPMSKMTAMCGLDCSSCPAFLATQADDDQKRAETAAIWAKQFNVAIKPEDVNCDGCLSRGGRLFTHPRVCEIRKCGMGKQAVNCGHCSEYACEKLTVLQGMAPDAKKELDGIHQELS